MQDLRSLFSRSRVKTDPFKGQKSTKAGEAAGMYGQESGPKTQSLPPSVSPTEGRGRRHEAETPPLCTDAKRHLIILGISILFFQGVMVSSLVFPSNR